MHNAYRNKFIPGARYLEVYRRDPEPPSSELSVLTLLERHARASRSALELCRRLAEETGEYRVAGGVERMLDGIKSLLTPPVHPDMFSDLRRVARTQRIERKRILRDEKGQIGLCGKLGEFVAVETAALMVGMGRDSLMRRNPSLFYDIETGLICMRRDDALALNARNEKPVESTPAVDPPRPGHGGRRIKKSDDEARTGILLAVGTSPGISRWDLQRAAHVDHHRSRRLIDEMVSDHRLLEGKEHGGKRAYSLPLSLEAPCPVADARPRARVEPRPLERRVGPQSSVEDMIARVMNNNGLTPEERGRMLAAMASQGK